LDETAALISYEEYHPFGTTSYRSGRTETEVSLKRYKYIGKERDEETGLYYYGARYYAGWVGRFVSVDPMATERQWLNPYNYVQNNPVNGVDPTGALDDDPPKGANPELYEEDSNALQSNGGSKFTSNPYWENSKTVKDDSGFFINSWENKSLAESDILSLVSKSNKQYVRFGDDGRVTLDFGDLDSNEISILKRRDEGLSLLSDLINSGKRILYEATDLILLRDEQGKKISGSMAKDSNLVVNASEGGLDSENKRIFRPREGYDGHVIVSSTGTWNELDSFNKTITVLKSRASIIFHELAENLERTKNNIDFNDKGPKVGAHNLAIRREYKWNKRSNTPGQANVKTKAQIFTANQMLFNQLSKKYFGYN
jgi:RHS repeat-associated protein